MSGDFITTAEATLLASRVKDAVKGFTIDLPNLITYINLTQADQLKVIKGTQNDGTETLIITCMKGGNDMYYTNGDGNNYVLEHITPLGGGGELF
jgi:hypothetical protein